MTIETEALPEAVTTPPAEPALDPGSEAKLALVFPDIADKWKRVRQGMWKDHQLQIRVTEGLRSYANQFALWSIGRKRNENGVWVIVDPSKIVTHARGGESYHQFGLALDSCFVGDDPFLEKKNPIECEQLWVAYGRLCEEHNLEWGGDWKAGKKDRPHCQKTYGLTLHAAQMIYENSGLKGIFDHCYQVLLDKK